MGIGDILHFNHINTLNHMMITKYRSFTVLTSIVALFLLGNTAFMPNHAKAQTIYVDSARVDDNSCVQMTLSIDGSGNITATTTSIPSDASIYSRLFTPGIPLNTDGSFSIPANGNTYWLIPFGDTIPCWAATPFGGSGGCTCGKSTDGTGTGKGQCCTGTIANCCDNCGCDGSCQFIVAMAGGGPGNYYTLTYAHSGILIRGNSLTYNGTFYGDPH